jgi:hypothetical protein
MFSKTNFFDMKIFFKVMLRGAREQSQGVAPYNPLPHVGPPAKICLG